MAKGKYQEWLEPDGLLLLAAWARDGLTNAQIANNMGISRDTLNEWKNKYSAIADALKKNKAIIDYEVENSLLGRCLGKYVDVGKAFKCKEVYYDDEGHRCEREEVKTVTVREYIPPETMAIAIWLNNRKPSSWRRNAGKEQLDRERFEYDKEKDF